MNIKVYLQVILVVLIASLDLAKNDTTDKELIKKTCLNYLEGFYEGDTTKVHNSIRPRLYKFGFWRDESGIYSGAYMTYEQAMNYAKEVLAKQEFPKKDSPKNIEILDISNYIAAAKMTAWWGVDYALLSKDNGKWKIEQVLWQGPLE